MFSTIWVFAIFLGYFIFVVSSVDNDGWKCSDSWSAISKTYARLFKHFSRRIYADGAVLISKWCFFSCFLCDQLYLFMTLVCSMLLVMFLIILMKFLRDSMTFTHPLAAILLSVAMLSLAGIPPLAKFGFVSKFVL